MENTDGVVGGKTGAIVNINKDTQSAKNDTATTLDILLASVKDMSSHMVSYDQQLSALSQKIDNTANTSTVTTVGPGNFTNS